MTPPRSIAVTGLETFEGRRLAGRLLARPSPPAVAGIGVRLPAALSGRVGHCALDPTEEGAGARLGEWLARERCEALVYVALPREAAPGREREPAVAGSQQILEAVAAAGLRKLVVAGSAEAYGARADNPDYLTEERPLRPDPHSPALRDLAQLEALLRVFAKRHPEVAVASLRPCWVAGPNYESPALRHLSAPRVPLPLGFDPLAQFLHEDDWLDALELALRREARGAFNLAGSGVLPLSTLLRLAGRRARRLPRPLFHSAAVRRRFGRPGGPEAAFYAYLRHGWRVDTRRAREELGFRPRYTTREAWLSRFVGQRLREYA